MLTSLLLLSIYAFTELPVSLLPKIDIPIITVRIDYPGKSTREILPISEKLKNSLLSISGLHDISAKTSTGKSEIILSFEYKTDIDYAYLEVNEKIDENSEEFPREMKRPLVIKAGIGDVPVFSLNMNSKESENEEKFRELSIFAKNVVQKRIDQLPAVAYCDISGYADPEIIIIPNDKISNNSIDIQKSIKETLITNNIEYGNIKLKSGQYLYDLKIGGKPVNIEQLKILPVRLDSVNYLKLSEVAKIETETKEIRGEYFYNKNHSIVFRIIKKNEAQFSEIKDQVSELVAQMKEDYPDLEFLISNDQTEVLNSSINNLLQSLIFGILLTALLLYLSDRRIKISLIGIFTIPVSLALSGLILYFAEVSINIVSLSGMILGVGLMIDNTIIVMEGINFYIKEGLSKKEAIVSGTSEIVGPLLSSGLTTVAVFVPLTFVGGLAGTVFSELAISVSSGLTASFLVSVLILPIVYSLLMGDNPGDVKKNDNLTDKNPYIRIFNFLSANKLILYLSVAAITGLGVFAVFSIKKEKTPQITESEFIVKIVYNDSYSVENRRHEIFDVLEDLYDKDTQIAFFAGEKQFVFDKKESNYNESEIYIKTAPDKVSTIKKKLYEKLKKNNNEISILKPENVYEMVFDPFQKITGPIIRPLTQRSLPNFEISKNFIQLIDENSEIMQTPATSLAVNTEKLMLYQIDYSSFIEKLKSEISPEYTILLDNGITNIPVVVSSEKESLTQILNKINIVSGSGNKYPVSDFISLNKTADYKYIYSDKKSEYNPIISKNYAKIRQEVIDNNTKSTNLEISLEEQDNSELFSEISKIMLLTLLLLYFILAVQFESFLQPLIVLLEIPISISASIFALMLFSQSLNIMSALGLIVNTGIVINDSILKLDSINSLRKSGYGLSEAVKLGSSKRNKSIILTSLTTITALIPLFFMSGTGAEMQIPFAITVISGMAVGTPVSLFLIPMIYKSIYKNKLLVVSCEL